MARRKIAKATLLGVAAGAVLIPLAAVGGTPTASAWVAGVSCPGEEGSEEYESCADSFAASCEAAGSTSGVLVELFGSHHELECTGPGTLPAPADGLFDLTPEPAAGGGDDKSDHDDDTAGESPDSGSGDDSGRNASGSAE